MNILTQRLLQITFIAALAAGCAQAGPETSVSEDAQKGVPTGWTTDYAAALKKAKAENKSIFIDFTGSDWCGWCIKLSDEVLKKQAFKDYAKENLVLVYIDFPRRKAQSEALKEQNDKLAKQYGVRGFPTVVILNSDGEKIGQMGYQKGGPEKYVADIQKIISKS